MHGIVYVNEGDMEQDPIEKEGKAIDAYASRYFSLCSLELGN